MKRGFLTRAARHAVVLICCTTLGGCGIYAANREATRYRSDMAEKLKKDIADCRENKSPTRHFLDHRIGETTEPDCYSAFITTTSRPLKEAPPPEPPTPDTPRSQKAATVKVWTPQELGQSTDAAAVLGQVAWPAVLSKMVYRRYVAQGNRGTCAIDPKLDPLERLKEVSKGGRGYWESWEGDGRGCKAASSGLFYETFVYRLRAGGMARKKAPITQAFIVFRGTENFKGQYWPDWSTNAAMAFDIAPPQFKQVQADLKDLIKGLQADTSDVRIYTAGHSLGGSMAQMAAYMSKDVKIAYAFNSSPVSGWTWLRELQGKDPAAIENDDPSIIRVMQEDEFAGFLRFFSNAANSTVRRTGRTDIELDFPSSRDVLTRIKSSGGLSDAGTLHSITLLACNLAARVANGASGPFGFTLEQAKTVLAERDGKYAVKGATSTEGMCQVVEDKKVCTIDWTGNRTTCTETPDA